MSGPQLPVQSPIQYARVAGDETVARVTWPDGSHADEELIQYDGPRLDWCAELGIPYMDEPDKLAAMAQARGFGPYGFECILLDESPTRFASRWRHRPREITFREDGSYLLTLSHIGFAIGSVGNIRLGAPGDVDGVEGNYLVATARLYDSALAARAWTGLVMGIFTAVCAVTARLRTAPIGTGELVEVSLADIGGCPNARIIKLLQETRFGVLQMTTKRVPIDELSPEVRRAIAMRTGQAR